MSPFVNGRDGCAFCDVRTVVGPTILVCVCVYSCSEQPFPPPFDLPLHGHRLNTHSNPIHTNSLDPPPISSSCSFCVGVYVYVCVCVCVCVQIHHVADEPEPPVAYTMNTNGEDEDDDQDADGEGRRRRRRLRYR